MQLNIVLVEPQIPQNTGNIARTCAATGARLHLVEPMGFKVDDKKLKRAGLDYWHLLDITYYENLDDFFKKMKTAIFIIFPPRHRTYTPTLSIPTMPISFSARRPRDFRRNCCTPILSDVCVCR